LNNAALKIDFKNEKCFPKNILQNLFDSISLQPITNSESEIIYARK